MDATFWYAQQYPWLLAPAFDPEGNEEETSACIARFLAIPKGSKRLDPGLGRKVRDLVETPEDMKAQPLYDTLCSAFMRSVVTSTAVERAFRSLTGWTNREGQGLPTIAAKHVYASFKAVASRWHKRCGRTSASGLGRLRPAWVKTHNRGFKRTGYHLFCQGKSGTSVWSGGHAGSGWKVHAKYVLSSMQGLSTCGIQQKQGPAR